MTQVKQDTTRVNLLNELAFSYQYKAPETGIKYGQEALQLAKNLKWPNGIAMANKNIGVNYSVTSDFSKALSYYEESLQSGAEDKIISYTLLSIGLIYTYQSNYPKAQEYNFKALKMFEDLDDQKGVAAALSNIGITHFDLNEYIKAKEYYEKALAINIEMGNSNYMSSNFVNLGNVYKDLNEIDKAIEFYNKALTLNEKTGNKTNKAIVLGALAMVYYDKTEFNKTLEFASAALKVNEENQDDRNISYNLGLIGDIYLDMAYINKDKKQQELLLNNSKKHLNTSLNLQLKQRNWKEIAFNHQQLSKVEALLNNYKEANNHSIKASIYKDSVYNEDSKETIKNLEDKRSIELRDKEIEINKITIQNKERQIWYSISGICLLVIIGSLLFYQSYNRRKTNKKLQLLNAELDQANKIKTRFFSILNHDLRSPVANLIHFLHLQKDQQHILDNETKERLESRTISGAENLLSSMEDILLWSKGQMENFKPEPKSIAVEDLFLDNKKVFSGYMNIHFEYHNPENLQLFTDENYLKTIMRNLTSNAINVIGNAKTPTITWKAWKENGQKFLSITDNGKGANQDQFKALYDETEVVGIKSGLGLHLIRDLAKVIDCDIKVNSQLGIGTTFTLLFK
ncbi:MAG TPA: tetratricopeptide repeat-containing sensor histidine kinase [Flavobacteriaceae bacterium]|nr:tetratricopeptide repeat-containing sensor histidine kinase [Flavobacteriaceae bacterium]